MREWPITNIPISRVSESLCAAAIDITISTTIATVTATVFTTATTYTTAASVCTAREGEMFN